jgi:hypothetical protein
VLTTGGSQDDGALIPCAGVSAISGSVRSARTWEATSFQHVGKDIQVSVA